MRFCPSCGTMNGDDDRFCKNCGTKLDWEDNINPETPDSHAIPNEEYHDAGQQTNEMESYPHYDNKTVWEEEMPAAQIRKKKLSKLQKTVIAEAVCLIAAIAAFFAAGNYKYSPGTVAERFFAAYASGDWAAMYAYLDLPEGAFLQEDMFEEMMENSQIQGITNYNITPSGRSEDGISRNYNVEYSIAGSGTSSMNLSLVQQGDNEMLFFDDWKVWMDGILSEDYQITVPAGTRIAVDGTELSDDVKIASASNGTDTYQLTLFNGVHTVTAAAPWCEIYESEFNTSGGGSLILSDLTPTSEGGLAFQAKLQEMLETFYSSAASGADFSEVEGLFADGAEDSDIYGDIKDRYEELKDSISHDPDDYYTFNQITFDNFSFESYMDNGMLMGELYFDYTIAYTYSGFGGTRSDTSTGTNNSVSAVFIYEEDTYKLMPVSITNYLWWQ